ncbi:MAG: ABC transporter ATP-binding protein [Coriobacteriia bacterium]|nr:ABC transporter ATP-binding protein [Coriobacteriia bacterium]
MADVLVDGLSVTYHGVDAEVRAVAGVDLSLLSSDAIAVIGPSGCGKSTLLLAIAGIVRPSSGCVTVAGEEVERPRIHTSLILQDFGLLPWKTVLQNAELGLSIRHHPPSETRRRALAALDRVGLSEFLRAFPSELSGGMRQRLALARALALDADLMLMDEPLSALDALTREDLQDLLLSLWYDRRYTSVLVTHSIEEAVYLGRRVVVMTPRPGRIAAVVDNPRMGDPDYRQTDAFYAKCAELRAVLAREGAVHPGGRGADPAFVPEGGIADGSDGGGAS